MMYWRLTIDRRGFRRRSFIFNTAGEALRFLAHDEDRVGTDPRDPDTRIFLMRSSTARRAVSG